MKERSSIPAVLYVQVLPCSEQRTVIRNPEALHREPPGPGDESMIFMSKSRNS